MNYQILCRMKQPRYAEQIVGSLYGLFEDAFITRSDTIINLEFDDREGSEMHGIRSCIRQYFPSLEIIDDIFTEFQPLMKDTPVRLYA